MTTKIWHPELSIILTQDIGDNCTLHAPIWIGKSVRIGHRVKIQAFCFIPDGLIIEDDCFIGPQSVFVNDLYPPSDESHWLPTIIRKGASIGANCTILCGLTIGHHSLIGAGSVVTHNVPPNQIWYGNPARFAKNRKEIPTK